MMEDNQRVRVVALASEMFVNEGIKAVRMDDIARRAAVSKRTLYEMFGDKDELIYLALSHHFDKIDKENTSIGLAAPNILVAYLKVSQNIICHSDKNWRILRNLRRFYPKINQRINEERGITQHQEFKKGLQVGVEMGLLNQNANLDLAIIMLTSVVTRLTQDTNNNRYASDTYVAPLPEEFSPQEALYEMMVYFLRGIATPSGIEIIDQFTVNEKQLNQNRE